jgi:hypothetical protein
MRMSKIMRLLLAGVVPAVVLMPNVAPAQGPAFSLSGDWSNTKNPNEPWSYNQGTTSLPLVESWTGGGYLNCSQPAWAPSNSAGDFLPALMKPNSCTAKYLGTDPHNGLPNVMPGDIVVHTVDGYNGDPAKGVANFLFTVPTGGDGTYQIGGFVWDADLYYGTSRPQGWELLVDGVNKASGSLTGSVSRSQAQTFNVNVNLAVGETVDLELFKNGEAGYFVGTNMSITRGCVLGDTPTYDATTGTLTMKFTIATPVAETWNGWLTTDNSIESLWSVAQTITEPAAAVTKTTTVEKKGNVGILSTLTTPTGGITCSSWQAVSTGIP